MTTEVLQTKTIRIKRKSRIRWEFILPLIPLLIWLLLLLIFPHLRLLLLSFMRRGQTSLFEGGIFFGNYLSPLQDPSLLFLRVFFRTIVFSLVNTCLTLLVAYPIAFFVAKILKGSSKALLLILIALPFYISELVRVYAWMNILRETGTLNYLLVNVLGVMQTPVEFLYSSQALFIVFVYSSMLVMIFPVYSSLEGLPDDQIQAAQDLGAGYLSTLRYVIFPFSLPGVTSGCILVFMLSVGNYLIPVLVGGKNNLWVTEMIYNRFIISTNWNLGSAYSIITLVMTSLVVWVGLRTTRQTLRGVFSE
jgi:spermidine/putrescine transport system permease protein